MRSALWFDGRWNVSEMRLAVCGHLVRQVTGQAGLGCFCWLWIDFTIHGCYLEAAKQKVDGRRCLVKTLLYSFL